MKTVYRLGVVLFSLLLWAWISPTSAQAAGVVGTGTPASCDGNALQNRITGGGLVTFNCGPNPHAILANTYVIEDDTTIDGGGQITLDGESLRRIFLLQPGVTLTLRNIALAKGQWPGGACVDVPNGASAVIQNVDFHECVAEQGVGGAIRNAGTTSVANSRFHNNSATGTGSIERGRGGAIHNAGTLTIVFSRFTQNAASVHGGAIFSGHTTTISDSEFGENSAGQGGGAIAALRELGTNRRVTVERSLFVANLAATHGGAIYNILGDVVVRNSTLSGNRAGEAGGGLYGDGLSVSTVEFSTINANRADLGGGVFLGFTGALTMSKSIVANSLNFAGTSSSLNCDNAGTFVTLGYNIAGDNSCFNPGQSTDLPATNPLLGNLTDNGGFTRTHLPNANSPALNKVPQAQCPGFDQRRALRLGSTCDIGAAERGGAFPQAYLPVLSK